MLHALVSHLICVPEHREPHNRGSVLGEHEREGEREPGDGGCVGQCSGGGPWTEGTRGEVK